MNEYAGYTFPTPEYEELSMETGGQHVEDPIWPSQLAEPPAVEVQTHGHPGIDTIHGFADMLQRVEEKVNDWIGREDSPERWPRRHDKPMIIATFMPASKSWRGVTFNVDREQKIVTARPDRTRVRITNWGPGILYLAHDTQSGGNPQPNSIQVPAPSAGSFNTQLNYRDFYTAGDVWAFPNTVGTAQVVDVQDEYGVPE